MFLDKGYVYGRLRGKSLVLSAAYLYKPSSTTSGEDALVRVDAPAVAECVFLAPYIDAVLTDAVVEAVPIAVTGEVIPPELQVFPIWADAIQAYGSLLAPQIVCTIGVIINAVPIEGETAFFIPAGVGSSTCILVPIPLRSLAVFNPPQDITKGDFDIYLFLDAVEELEYSLTACDSTDLFLKIPAQVVINLCVE